MERIAKIAGSLKQSEILLERSNILMSENLGNESAPLVLVTIEGPIGIVTMNSAKNLNALNEAMRSAIVEALKKLERDPNVKVVVLNSNSPKVFCAGADIKEFEPLTYTKKMLVDNFKEISIMLETMRKPMVASVNRMAFGGGFELCLGCDVIVCDEEAVFGLPEITLGIFPGIGGTLVSKTIGKHRAMEMILTGGRVPALKMQQWGIVNHIVKKEELKQATMKVANDIAKMSLTSLMLAKSSVKFAYENSSDAARQFERRLFDTLDNSLPGTKEGVNAFINKRKPNFDGI